MTLYVNSYDSDVAIVIIWCVDLFHYIKVCIYKYYILIMKLANPINFVNPNSYKNYLLSPQCSADFFFNFQVK